MDWFFYVLTWQIIMAIICAMVASSKRGWATGLIFFFYGLVIWPIALTHAILMKTSVVQNHSRIDGVLAGKPYRKLDDDSVTVIIEGNDVNFQSLEEAEQALSAKAFPVDNRSEAELIGQKFEAKTGISRAVIFFLIISAMGSAYALKTIVSSPSATDDKTDYTKADPNDHPATTVYNPPAAPSSTTGVYNQSCRGMIDKLIQETSSPWSGTSADGNMGTMINEKYQIAFNIDCTNLKQKNIIFSFPSSIPSKTGLNFIGKVASSFTGDNSATIEKEVKNCLKSSLKQSENTISQKFSFFEIICSATRPGKTTREGSLIRIYELGG